MRQDRSDLIDWRPDAVQDALLTVALAPAADVAGAWSLHRSTIPVEALDTLEWGTRRLVPLVAWRLREAGVDDPAVAALRADLAASMLASRAKLPGFVEVLSTFEAAGIAILVLKGVGIAPLAYPDPGTRPVNDLDVLVRNDQVAALEDLVARHGGYPSYRTWAPAVRARYRHAGDASIAGHPVDIHWRLLASRHDGGPDGALFDRALSVPIGRHRARTLAVEDHIVHTISHGLRPNNALSPVRWITDVARLVQGCPVDWSLVEEQAGRRHLEGVVGSALAFVHRRYAVPVPPATLAALRHAGSRAWGRLDLWSRSPRRFQASHAVNLGVVHYALATRGCSPRERVLRYPGYLRCVWAFRHGWRADPHSPLGRWHG